MAASATAGERVVLVAADDFGLVNLDQAGEHAAVGRHHAAAQLCRHQPSRFVRAQSKLALQLQCRDAVGMGRHQIGRPEPRGQRQLGVVHDRAGGHRGLLAAAGAFPSPCLGLQLPRFVPAASRADKALRPACRDKVSDAGRLIREAALKPTSEREKSGICASRTKPCVRCMFYHPRGRRATTNRVPGQGDKPLHRIIGCRTRRRCSAFRLDIWMRGNFATSWRKCSLTDVTSLLVEIGPCYYGLRQQHRYFHHVF